VLPLLPLSLDRMLLLLLPARVMKIMAFSMKKMGVSELQSTYWLKLHCYARA
jgi:hypothetical protein